MVSDEARSLSFSLSFSPHIVQTAANLDLLLGVCLMNQGRPEETVALLRARRAGHEGALGGATHPRCVDATLVECMALERLGRHAEAQPLRRAVTDLKHAEGAARGD